MSVKCRTRQSTQSTLVSAASTTELDSGGVGHSRDKTPKVSSLVTQKHLDECITALSESTEHNLQPLNLHEEALFLNLGHHMGRQLIRRVKSGTASFAETNLATANGHERVAVWPCQGENCVVLVAVDVEVVGRSSIGVRVLHHFGLDVLGKFRRLGFL